MTFLLPSRDRAIARVADVRAKLDQRNITTTAAVLDAYEVLDRIAATHPVQPAATAVRDLILDDADDADVFAGLLAEDVFARWRSAHAQARIEAAVRVLRALADDADLIFEQLKVRADDAIAHIEKVAAFGGLNVAALVETGRADDAHALVTVPTVAAELDVLYTIRDFYLAPWGYLRGARWDCSRWIDPRDPARRPIKGDDTTADVFVGGVTAGGRLWFPTPDEAVAASDEIDTEIRTEARRAEFSPYRGGSGFSAV